MKTTFIASALIILGVAASGSALAQRDSHSNDNNYGHDQTQQQNSDRHNNNRNDNARNGSSHADNWDSHATRYRDQPRLSRQERTQNDAPRHDSRRAYVSNDHRSYRHAVSYRSSRHVTKPSRSEYHDKTGNY